MFKKRAARNARKFRRYGNIYHQAQAMRRARRILAAVLGVAAVVALAWLGWMSYPKVRDRFLNAAPEEPVSQAQPQEPDRIAVSVQTELQAPAAQETSAAPVREGPSRGVFVSAALAADDARLQALLAEAAAGGADRMLVEAKGADGVLFYRSENERARNAKAVSASAYEAQRVAAAIREAGLTPAARLYAFRDPLMSGKYREMAVLYGNTTARWLDNAADRGGKSWLNPCAESAQQYVTDLALELVEAGFEEIVVSAVQFPSGLSVERASYGMPRNFSRSGVLAAFVSALTDHVEAAGGRVIVDLPADCIAEGKEGKAAEALARQNANLYGGDPQAIVGERAMVTLGVSSDQTAIRAFMEKNPAVAWAVCVPSYAMDGDAITASEAVGAFGSRRDYILYNPSGTYLFN